MPFWDLSAAVGGEGAANALRLGAVSGLAPAPIRLRQKESLQNVFLAPEEAKGIFLAWLVSR